MSVEIRVIPKDKKSLKKFVQFGTDMYKGNDCFVPPLRMDDVNTLSPDVNPAFELCDAEYFMAFRDGKPVGRIAAIIHRLSNEQRGKKEMRFGFVEFIDDEEVCDALFNAAIAWGKERGMETIIGPLGFSDMDYEGMLIEGFDELSTSATIYNYPYYKEHLDALGYEKETDWVEFNVQIPDAIPEKMVRIADIVRRKYDLHVAPRNMSMKKFLAKYGSSFFTCINAAFKPLFGYSELTERQKRDYLDMYSMILDIDLISLVLDKEERVVACGVAIPSLSKALQKSGGKMFPLGWWHLLKALKWKHSKTADLLLAAVLPEYQGKGLNAVFISDLYPNFIKGGFKQVETNVELESNSKIQSQWAYFENRQHKRRRCFTKKI